MVFSSIALPKGVKDLVDAGALTKIPDIYVKPLDKRPIADEVLPGDCIPVIDLEGLYTGKDRAGVVKAITQAAREWGLFQVINHGVPDHVVEAMVSGVMEFFRLPIEHKMMYYSEEVFTPVRYCTSMTPSKETHMEWHDHLQHYIASGQVNKHPWSLLDLPNYEHAAKAYLTKITTLSKRLKSALSEGLGLRSNAIDKGFGEQEVIMRSNYYPPCPNPDLALGMNGHSDSGGLTILLQDQVGGLQALKDGRWYAVNPIPGALTINVADQIEILSNGAYKSVEHRVVVNSSLPRLSIVVFCNPSKDAVIGPMEELLDENNQALYKSTLYGEHITNVYNTYLDGKHSKMLQN